MKLLRPLLAFAAIGGALGCHMSSVDWRDAVLAHAREHHSCPPDRVQILQCDWRGEPVVARVCGDYWVFEEVGGRGDYEFADLHQLVPATP